MNPLIYFHCDSVEQSSYFGHRNDFLYVTLDNNRNRFKTGTYFIGLSCRTTKPCCTVFREKQTKSSFLCVDEVFLILRQPKEFAMISFLENHKLNFG